MEGMVTVYPMTSCYDEIAGLYDSAWSDWYLPAALPALERLFFCCVHEGARVLDLCCGSGHVTKELVRRGYEVTGVDSSAALIEIARRKLPEAQFEIQNAEQFDVGSHFGAVLSTFDSMNHVLSLEGLGRVFSRVYDCLLPGGRFVFDMNLGEAYFLDLSQWHVTLTDDMVGLVRGHYNPGEKKAITELVWFSRNSDGQTWIRHNSNVEQRCYETEEIVAALRGSGFENIETLTARQAGMQAELGIGRIFLVAIR